MSKRMSKRQREEITLEHIKNEVLDAKNHNRDFSFSVSQKSELVSKYGVEKVYETLIQSIRDTNTHIIDKLSLDVSEPKLLGLIERVIKESNKDHPDDTEWGYKEGSDIVQHKSTLLSVSSSGSMLSTLLNGYYRYTQRMVKGARTPEENWNDDKMLQKSIVYNCSNEIKAKTEALSRNRLRVFCMQGNGCHYGTAFPVSVVSWILKREARRKPNKKLLRIIDPCAGWGDRLAGSLIVGKNVVEHYYGIDPWFISNESCRNIYNVLSGIPSLNIGTATISQKGAQDESEPWPEADLVLICPPYAELECYNVDSTDVNDKQAWRLCQQSEEGKDKFMTDFIVPMLRNALKAITSRNGRIIVNIANTSKKGKGEYLTRNVLKAADELGLKCVETFGMRLSVRAPKTTYEHGADILRGEPFFVFERVSEGAPKNTVKEKIKVI